MADFNNSNGHKSHNWKLCQHRRLQVHWKITRGIATVTCTFCGFSVEVTGDSLNEEIIRLEFNEAARRAFTDPRTFI